MEMAAKPKMMMARESSPPVVQQKARRWQDEVRGGGGGPPQGRPAPLPPSWDAQPDQLAYGLLRLPAYDEYGRGKLQSQTPMQACLRLWKAAHPNLTFDPAQVLQSALQASRKALQVQPLESHRLPTAVTGFDYLYPGESPVDLPTDAEFHSLPLLKRQLTARLQFVSVPKKTTDVFRLAEVESLPDLAMPAGPVDVFVGRDYLLTTTLADVAPGERVNLGLGVEQGIKVARNTSYKESTSGMLGGTLLLRHSLDVEVANRLSREVRLEVREVVPQARPDQDEVKVRVESSEPPWHGSATEGRYRWNVSLPAGDKLTLKAVYVIEMPAKLELLGGNRREE